MANVTDPLARAIHGTDPQNLIEYITRQRIYDSLFWKEQCFGLTATDVAEKVVQQVQALGGTYGGNNKPTRFLCLTLKLLQIQPEDDVIDELISNDDFKYVRALGIFYLRLTGRPADIYEKLEPVLMDYRKLRRRNQNDWSIIRMDEFVESLLRDERVCGVALPRLPKRDILVQGGYLEGPRPSPMYAILWPDSNANFSLPDDLESLKSCANRIETVLDQMSRAGNSHAKIVLDKRRERRLETSSNVDDDNNKAKKSTKSTMGSRLFKRPAVSSSEQEKNASIELPDNSNDGVAIEHSDEYWNEQRKMLGMKPLH